ncbi:MAG: 50S ribosomal protein L3 [Halanaerobium sp.]|nr:50S ribosomal protein L3 [Halanaerobium sp.]
MPKGLLGKKVGMTQVFDDKGNVIPVTVIQTGPCMVVQKKTEETDGYNAIQVGFGEVKKHKVNKPLQGHYSSHDVEPYRYLAEFRVDNPDEFEEGQELKVDQVFAPGQLVDIAGTSRGKGFAGTVKRYGFNRGPMSHGSHNHRAPGSIGATDAARVFKGQKLPGRMGGTRVTVQNLEVVQTDGDNNLLLVKGAIPGPKKGLVEIKEAIKAG